MRFKKSELVSRKKIIIPKWPDYASQNGHTFYFITASIHERNKLIKFLKKNGIQATFHYTPLHLSKYYLDNFEATSLPNAEKYGNCLIRLPLFTNMTEQQIDYVIHFVNLFYK